MKTYDVIICGAGSAGCVLANRLTEDDGRKVLLLEAGPDYADSDYLPPEIKNGLKPTYSHDWGYTSLPDEMGRAIPLRRAKLTGGCSATNASIALRGAPADYDAWEESGNEGWSYKNVLPYFRKLEHDYNFDNELHGQDGPIGIRRCAVNETNDIQKSFLEYWLSKGYTYREDFNGTEIDGAGPVPSNCINGVRLSTSLTYLATARSRPNLKIISGTTVDKVIFDNNKAVGVRTFDGDEQYYADKIILSAGTYGSPAILMRSGIGDASILKSIGIKVISELPDVGLNLKDHPLIGLHFSSNPERANNDEPLVQSILMTKSSGERKETDIQLMIRSIYESAKSPTGADTVVFAALIKPYSHGYLRISSADASIQPEICMRYLSVPEDMERLLSGVKKILELSSSNKFSTHITEPLNFDPSMMKKDSGIKDFIKRKVETYHHPVGTCSMGSVVNVNGKVFGVEGLFIADASIMPDIPSANTNIPVIMIAEKMSDTIT